MFPSSRLQALAPPIWKRLHTLYMRHSQSERKEVQTKDGLKVPNGAYSYHGSPRVLAKDFIGFARSIDRSRPSLSMGNTRASREDSHTAGRTKTLICQATLGNLDSTSNPRSLPWQKTTR